MSARKILSLTAVSAIISVLTLTGCASNDEHVVDAGTEASAPSASPTIALTPAEAAYGKDGIVAAITTTDAAIQASTQSPYGTPDIELPPEDAAIYQIGSYSSLQASLTPELWSALQAELSAKIAEVNSMDENGYIELTRIATAFGVPPSFVGALFRDRGQGQNSSEWQEFDEVIRDTENIGAITIEALGEPDVSLNTSGALVLTTETLAKYQNTNIAGEVQNGRFYRLTEFVMAEQADGSFLIADANVIKKTATKDDAKTLDNLRHEASPLILTDADEAAADAANLAAEAAANAAGVPVE